jgi:HlyD family secretion protein
MKHLKLPIRKPTTLIALCVCLGGVGLIAALLTALSGALYVGPSRAASEDKSTAKPSLTVTTVSPVLSTIAASFGASGNIAAWQEAIIGAETNGLRINDVRAGVGDIVRKGQVLVTFAPETVEAELAQTRAAVAEAEAALAEAQANADRAKTLESSGALSTQQIQQYTTAAKTAEARLAAARANAKVNQVRLTQTQLLAPDDGTISSRTATIGGVVAPGQELFRMVRKNRLEWRAEVTASELADVRVGQKVRVITPAGESVAGTVRIVAPTVDPQTRNVQVYVDLSPNKAAKAGMFARGEFQLNPSSAITVPQQAIVTRDGFAYAFTVGQDNRIKQLKVETGRRVADRIEIKNGLTDKSMVVASGAGFLKDGDLVRIVAPSVSPAKTPTSPTVGTATSTKK